MSGLRGRITKLERNVPTGLEAKLRALSDEELERRLDELLMRASEEDSYGDKLTLEAGVSVRQMSDEQLNARLTQLLEHRRETTTWPKRETPPELSVASPSRPEKE